MMVNGPKPPVAWDGESYAIYLPSPPDESRGEWMEFSVTPQVTYVVRIRELGTDEWIIGVETPLTSCSFIGLKPETNYEMEVRAKNAAGESAPAVATWRTDSAGTMKPVSMTEA